MRISQLSSAALAILFAGSIFTSCQKEDLATSNPTQTVSTQQVGDRGPGVGLMYGVTAIKTSAPSLLVTMDPAAETVLANVQVNYNGNLINDLRGVCCVADQVYVTTGPNAVDALNNLLLRVDPQTGQANFISQSTVGTVSDIDYNPFNGNIYGLTKNNRLVTIVNGFQNYGTAAFTLPFSTGGIAQGLSFVRTSLIDPQAISLKITSVDAAATVGTVRFYQLPLTGGAATFQSVINPAIALAGGNCGIGYISNVGGPLGRIFINKNASTDANTGLNRFDFANPLAANVLSVDTNIDLFNFDDLSTTL